jgi:hypothetical protein
MTKACYKCYSDVSRPYCMSCLLLKHCAQGDMPCQMRKVNAQANLQRRERGSRSLQLGLRLMFAVSDVLARAPRVQACKVCEQIKGQGTYEPKLCSIVKC